jgi:hypothetical protein
MLAKWDPQEAFPTPLQPSRLMRIIKVPDQAATLNGQ